MTDKQRLRATRPGAVNTTTNRTHSTTGDFLQEVVPHDDRVVTPDPPTPLFLAIDPDEGKACYTKGWSGIHYKGIDPTSVQYLGRRCDGLVVVDCDTDDAAKQWLALIGLDLGHTFCVKTKRGYHFYYEATPGAPSRSRDLRKYGYDIDLKAGRGALVVIPPTPGKTVLHDVPMLPWLPAWLERITSVSRANGETTESHRIQHRTQLADLLANPPASNEVGWNNWLTQVAGHLAKRERYEDAYRAQLQLIADSLDGTWKDGEVDKIATSVWDTEHNKPKPTKHLEFIRANEVEPTPSWWVWGQPDNQRVGRIGRGELTLLVGRPGVGKSTIALDLASALTRGELPGVHCGTPKGVVVVATEDSYSHTIVPRLMADGADLSRIAFVKVVDTAGGIHRPEDLAELEVQCRDLDVGMVILDPLISRLSGKLDTHKDQETRQALEPLADFAERMQLALVGLIHTNKSGTNDPLDAVMASRAFSAVARSVLFVMRKPRSDDDLLQGDNGDDTYLCGHVKCNGGPRQPMLSYRIVEKVVAGTGDERVVGSKIEWGEEIAMTIEEALEASRQPHTAKRESAEQWLEDFFVRHGPTDRSAVVDAGKRAGFSERTLARAYKELGGRGQDKPGQKAVWSLPDPQLPGLS